MSLLDQFWDDTAAGPCPDNGLGKLRKQSSFGVRSRSSKESDGRNIKSSDATRVTRSIMIVKPPGYQSGSPLVSPDGSTPPASPFSGSREGFEEGLLRMFTRRRRERKLDSGALLLLTPSDI